MNVTLKIALILLCFAPLATLVVRDFRRALKHSKELDRASPQYASRRRRPF